MKLRKWGKIKRGKLGIGGMSQWNACKTSQEGDKLWKMVLEERKKEKKKERKKEIQEKKD